MVRAEDAGVVGEKGEEGRLEVRMRFSIGVEVDELVGGALLLAGRQPVGQAVVAEVGRFWSFGCAMLSENAETLLFVLHYFEFNLEVVDMASSRVSQRVSATSLMSRASLQSASCTKAARYSLGDGGKRMWLWSSFCSIRAE